MNPLILVSAYSLDLALGDPRWLPHPVRMLGRIIVACERYLRRHISNLRLAGIILFLSVTSFAYIFTYSILNAAKGISPICYNILSIIFIYYAISIRDLDSHIRPIISALKNGDLPSARQGLRGIVGRDTELLNEKDIIRAAVETIAESSVDGIISPIIFAALVGPAWAMTYKAVNTLDSMVGYKNERYRELGWASAKLDGLFNFIPAISSGFILPIAGFVVKRGFKKSALCVLKYGLRFPWQNSNIPESAMAGALGVQLGGANYYEGQKVDKPLLGEPEREFAMRDIRDAMKIVYMASFLSLIFGMGICYILLWPL